MLKPRVVIDIVFWIVVIAAPIAACAIAVAQFPPGSTNVPMHWSHGEVDRYGSALEMFVIGFIMASTNGLMALCFAFNDWLFNHGLAHGVSRKGALVLYRVLAVFMVVITAAILVFWTSQALPFVFMA